MVSNHHRRCSLFLLVLFMAATFLTLFNILLGFEYWTLWNDNNHNSGGAAAAWVVSGLDLVNNMIPLKENNGKVSAPENEATRVAARIELYKKRFRYQPAMRRDEYRLLQRQRQRQEQSAASNSTNNATSVDMMSLLCGSYPNYTEWFQLDHKSRSRLDEDKIIYEVFFKEDYYSDNRNDDKNNSNSHRHTTSVVGTFLEIGAYDGVQESNTHFFDVCLGWNGLLIEGNPTLWDRLVEHRPTSHRMSFIPSCSIPEQEANHTIAFHAIGSTNAGVEAPEQGVHLVYNHRTDHVPVPCGSLWQVLVDLFPMDHGHGSGGGRRGKVSFWSLDVEGSEHLILEKVDFSKAYIEIIMLEVRNGFCRRYRPCKARDRSREILRNNGYTRFSFRVDNSDVFVHPLSTHLLERAKKAGWEPSLDDPSLPNTTNTSLKIS
ncbi:hypothetical protein ACA910_006000 [Epithemia clementina (nom. ined.)]